MMNGVPQTKKQHRVNHFVRLFFVCANILMASNFLFNLSVNSFTRKIISGVSRVVFLGISQANSAFIQIEEAAFFRASSKWN